MLNAFCVWTLARSAGGRVLLRIEDHDCERCRPEYESGILEDLDWLGFVPDLLPTSAYRAGRCEGRQSERDAYYLEAVCRLRERRLVYACDCSRREIQSASRLVSGESPIELRYSGRCRNRGLPLDPGYGWRVRMDPGA